MTNRLKIQVPFWTLWPILDAACLATGSLAGLGGALAMHATAVTGGSIWLAHREMNRTGWPSLLAFGVLFSLINPVVGPALAAWMLERRPSRKEEAAEEPGWVLGNPRDGVEEDSTKQVDITEEPLVASLARGRQGELRGVISRVRGDDAKPVVDVLRRIAKESSAWSQLFANAAVLTLREESEAMLRRLHGAQRDCPEEDRFRLWLASGLRKSALSGLRNEEEAAQDLELASRYYGEVVSQAPNDVEAWNGWADCLWRMGRTEELGLAVERLREIPEAQNEALLHECRLRCQVGDWVRTCAGVGACLEGWAGMRTSAIRDFWLEQPPERHG